MDLLTSGGQPCECKVSGTTGHNLRCPVAHSADALLPGVRGLRSLLGAGHGLVCLPPSLCAAAAPGAHQQLGVPPLTSGNSAAPEGPPRGTTASSITGALIRVSALRPPSWPRVVIRGSASYGLVERLSGVLLSSVRCWGLQGPLQMSKDPLQHVGYRDLRHATGMRFSVEFAGSSISVLTHPV
ncbi:hypothetical protein NDU88_005030 [Pleurodeles waltl]|uniref:Uncharacterized protein n=1 Tax=Pleurodeles waltl TaxID=8319 RepID=A0AAV7WX48_PLEWA|nr:hypothetical protein NDU88_005030 [Pleurodeles waltl]